MARIHAEERARNPWPRAEYLLAASSAIERTYGSTDAFLSEILGIEAKERHQLQALYLE